MTSGRQSSAPVKLLIDAQGDVVQDISSISSQVPGSASGIMEESAMSLDDQQEIVHNIRQQHRDSGVHNAQNGNGHHHAATVSEEQRLWSNKAIPPATILLVIGRLPCSIKDLTAHADLSILLL